METTLNMAIEKLKKWGVYEADDRTMHVCPISEYHFLDEFCSYKPEQDDNGEIIHNECH